MSGAMNTTESGPIADEAFPYGIPESHIERACRMMSAAALIITLPLIGLDIVTRTFFNYSFEISDEVGAYLLVAITFLSLPVSQAAGSFHHVQFVQSKLSLRGQVISRLIFDGTALFFSAIALWKYIEFVLVTWQFDDRAPTILYTPLWIPRSLLVVGMMALCFSLCRALIADMRRLRRGSTASPRTAV